MKVSHQFLHLGFQKETAEKYLVDNTHAGILIVFSFVLTYLEVIGDFTFLSYLSKALLVLNCSLYLSDDI